MHLKSLITAPPGGGGGWVYKQEESGHWMKGVTLDQLLGHIAQHRANMKYPAVTPPYISLVEEVEDWICQRMDPATQIKKCKSGVRHRSSIHWKEVLDFLTANLKWVLQGKQLVPTEEAERRAAICAACPLNVRMHGCGICAETIKEYRQRIIQSGTTKDAQLNACGVCSCDLKSIVHLPLSVLQKDRPLEFPKWCWQQPVAEPPPADPQSK